jgi:hypothetical protein
MKTINIFEVPDRKQLIPSEASKILTVFYVKLQRYELFSIWSFKGINCFLSGTSKV